MQSFVCRFTEYKSDCQRIRLQKGGQWSCTAKAFSFSTRALLLSDPVDSGPQAHAAVSYLGTFPVPAV